MKVAVIRTLSTIGSTEPFIRDILLDTLHFHPEPKLRTAACKAITGLGKYKFFLPLPKI